MDASRTISTPPGDRPGASFLARAQALVAEHAELFRPPVTEASLRVVTASRWSAGRAAPQRSPGSSRRQLTLPLRPTIRR